MSLDGGVVAAQLDRVERNSAHRSLYGFPAAGRGNLEGLVGYAAVVLRL